MSTPSPLRALCPGAGYCGRYRHEAWQRMEDVELVGICDPDEEKMASACRAIGCPEAATDVAAALDRLQPDALDMITPPATHLELTELGGRRGCAVVCQKPPAPSLDEAVDIVETAERLKVRFMVHENFRFRRGHREVRRLLDSGAISICTRLGDGHGEDAYLDRQPDFREMPCLLIHETGVHFLDTGLEHCSAAVSACWRFSRQPSRSPGLPFLPIAPAVWSQKRHIAGISEAERERSAEARNRTRVLE